MCSRVPQELTLFWLFQIGRGDKERSEKVKSPFFFKKLFLAKVEFAKLFIFFFFFLAKKISYCISVLSSLVRFHINDFLFSDTQYDIKSILKD